ncbi:molybdopterin-dependent oxidoreductase [Candidatus Woesearchaeota archaeon]|nr:molybdopterin-dependent oxidoreductase [Candidatus Woesearchaeota archaeon]
MKHRKKTLLILIALFLSSAAIILSGCAADLFGDPDIERLESVEVKDYQGEKLGSIGDFRENSIQGVQYIDIDDYTLDITGLVEEPKPLTYDEVLALDKYSKAVRIYCVEGWDVNILWEGVLVKDIIDLAGARPEVNTVIFHAYDGYTTSHPLYYLIDNDILIAYRMNNVTIPPERGFPFQLVAEDKWGYKWIKWITEIELSNDTSYTGTWESAGYNNQGDLDGPIFER